MESIREISSNLREISIASYCDVIERHRDISYVSNEGTVRTFLDSNKMLFSWSKVRSLIKRQAILHCNYIKVDVAKD